MPGPSDDERKLLEYVTALAWSQPSANCADIGDQAFELAIEQRVLPLVVDALLQSTNVDRQRLAIADLRLRHRYRIAEEELLRVATVAQGLGVEIGVVKGVINAERWFSEDPSVRRCSDIDLFLDPTDTSGTDRLLQALDPENPLCGRAGQLMADGVLPDVPITSGKVLIEIHANPMTLRLSPSRLAALWNSTTSTQTRAGARVRCFDATYGLLNALINSAKDNHAYLLQVIEIGRAVQDPSVDWRRFEQTVRDAHWDAVIDDALRYVCSLLGLSYPPIVLRPEPIAAMTLRRLAPLDGRLGGLESWRRAQRFCKLDLTIPGSRVHSMSGVITRTLSPDAYITAFAPDLTGPYLLRAAKFWVRRQQYVKGERSSLAGPSTWKRVKGEES